MAYRSNVKSWRDDSILIVKAVLSHIIKGTDLDTSKIELLPSSLPSYHPKKQARVQYDGMLIGFVGTVHPLITDAYKIPEKGQVSYMDINLSALENSMPSQKYYSNRFATLQDQLLTRDISLVVPHTMPLGTVIDAIQALATVSSVDVFDLYAGESLGADKKSMACTISIKGDGSMTTEHINAIVQDAVKAAESVGAKLRE
jgi:phenylalanyl-tRNA synthetase beta chain